MFPADIASLLRRYVRTNGNRSDRAVPRVLSHQVPLPQSRLPSIPRSSRSARYTATARETLDYLANEMRDETGGIHAAEDADSEGEEGKFYVWSYDEFRRVAAADADVVGDLYGVTRAGNFEGSNNLHLAATPLDVAARHGVDEDDVIAAKHRVDAALLRVREDRIRPARDDKAIAAWNGLALRTFAEAAVILDEATYLEVAVGIARFLTADLTDAAGQLLRAARQGITSGPGFCMDYAAAAVGLFTLYQTTADEQWYQAATRLTQEMERLFAGEDGFFTTAADQSDLIARPRDFADNPLPSANSLAAEALLIRTAYTGEQSPHIATISRGAARLLEQAPHAVGHLLGVLLTVTTGLKEVAIVGAPADRKPLEQVVWETFRPDYVVAAGDHATTVVPLLEGPGNRCCCSRGPRLSQFHMRSPGIHPL